MAVSAYVFIECTQGKAISVKEEVAKKTGIQHAHAVTGPYDVIALVEASDISTLGEFVVENIQTVPGVLRTATNIVVA